MTRKEVTGEEMMEEEMMGTEMPEQGMTTPWLTLMPVSKP